MSTENGGFFKTAAFGGFDKKDVLNYVDELHRKIFKLEGDMAKVLEENDRLTQELNNAAPAPQEQGGDESIVSLGEAMVALRDELSKREEAIRVLNQQIAGLNHKVEEQRSYAATRENEIASLNARINQMKERVSKYDEASIDVGTVILDARHTADQIIREAKERAAQISAEAVGFVGELDHKLGKLQGFVEDINSNIEDSLRRQSTRNQSILEMIEKARGSVKAPQITRPQEAPAPKPVPKPAPLVQTQVVAPEVPWMGGKTEIAGQTQIQLPEPEQTVEPAIPQPQAAPEPEPEVPAVAPLDPNDIPKEWRIGPDTQSAAPGTNTWQPEAGDENIFR